MSGLLNKIFKSDEEKEVDAKKSNNKSSDPTAEVKSPAEFKSGSITKQSEPKIVEVKEVKQEKAVVKRVKVQKKDDPEIYKILIEPLITEKATDLMQLNKYCFIVPVSTNKSEVVKKVMNLYGVKPVKVNFIRKKGKRVRYGRRFGKTKDFKKAIITLHPEDKIEVYEGV